MYIWWCIRVVKLLQLLIAEWQNSRDKYFVRRCFFRSFNRALLIARPRSARVPGRTCNSSIRIQDRNIRRHIFLHSHPDSYGSLYYFSCVSTPFFAIFILSLDISPPGFIPCPITPLDLRLRARTIRAFRGGHVEATTYFQRGNRLS